MTKYRFHADYTGRNDPRWRRLCATVVPETGAAEGYPQRFVVFHAEWIDKSGSVGVHWRTDREFDRIPGLLASVALGDHIASLLLSDLLQDTDAPAWLWRAVKGDADWWADLPPDDGQRDRDAELIERINALPLARRVRVAREIEGVRVGRPGTHREAEIDMSGLISWNEFYRRVGIDVPTNPHPPTAPTHPDTPR